MINKVVVFFNEIYHGYSRRVFTLLKGCWENKVSWNIKIEMKHRMLDDSRKILESERYKDNGWYGRKISQKINEGDKQGLLTKL